MEKIKKLYNVILTAAFFLLCIMSFNCSKDTIDLGKSYVKEPDPEKVIITEYGMIPVNQFALIMKEDYGKKDADRIAQEYGGTVVGEIEFINLYQIETGFSGEDELNKALSELSKKEGVENAFVNAAVFLRKGESFSCDPLDDPFYDDAIYSTPYDIINLKDAWKYIRACGIELSEVNVGVNDDPLQITTSELYIRGNDIINNKVEERINKGISMVSDINIRTEQSKIMGGGHSNAVIDIIAANNKNGGKTGTASILGSKLKIKHIDTFDSYGLDKGTPETETDTSDNTQFHKNGKSYSCSMLNDLKKQVEKGSTIINCSFGTNDPNNKELIKAFKKFLNKMAERHPDVIFIGAAGDNNLELDGENDSWGSKHANLITVGMITGDGEKSAGTNYAGPNGEITVSVCGKINGSHDATSYCAPQVTGIIALMRSINPKLSAAEIKDILQKTASKDINGKKVDPSMGAGCLNAADAVMWVINTVRINNKLDSLSKEKLENLASLELSATDGPKDYTVTASVKSVSDKGTTFSIDIAGSDYVLKGDHVKSLNSAGSVSWDISLGENSGEITVKVKRIDTDGCAYIVLGGEIKAEDLVGNWTGNVIALSWTASSELVRKMASETIDPEIEKEKPLKLDVTLIDENTVGIALHVTGGKPIPSQKFSFTGAQLYSEFYAHENNYIYNAMVERSGGKLVISGKWSSDNKFIDMNGTWTAEK